MPVSPARTQPATIVSGQMRTAAILPVKRFADAKQRLGASVADPLRLELARAMVADVLLALDETGAIERTIVVTCEESVADGARAQGALVVAEEVGDGQSAAVALGIRRALAEGFERVLCVPGDCPALDPAELDELLGAHAPNRRDENSRPALADRDENPPPALGRPRGKSSPRVADRDEDSPPALADRDAAGEERRGDRVPEVVIVPDRHGTGTNGLLLTPPAVIVTQLRARQL